MQNSVWIDLLRMIPPHLHSMLSIVSSTGQETIVQQFYRFDSEVLVMRARLSGSMEGSRIIILPYSHIDYLAFTKVMTEAEIAEIFTNSGGNMSAMVPAPRKETASPEPATPSLTAPQAASPRTSGPGVAPMTAGPGSTMQTAGLSARLNNRQETVNLVAPLTPPAGQSGSQSEGSDSNKAAGQVSKTLLLARLRERLSQKK